MSSTFVDPYSYKVIYVIEVNDSAHNGYLKIGDASLLSTKAPEELPPNCPDLNEAAWIRIKEYSNTLGIRPTLLHTELAIRHADNQSGTCKYEGFRDHSIHDVLKNSSIKNKKINNTTGREWFKITLDTARNAIQAVKSGQENLSGCPSNEPNCIIFRPEQEDAIKKTQKQFQTGDSMLWNAKMRYGKTLTALELVRRQHYQKTIIITHRPVVDDGWYDDFTKIFSGDSSYIYGSKNKGNPIDSLLDSRKNFVYFASIQDLRGSSKVGGKYQKNELIYSTVWDLVIVDEAHEGTTTALGDEVIKNIVKRDGVAKTRFLALSGTPFNIIGEYSDNSIYTWDYINEQRSKRNWNFEQFGDSNPYDDLPELNIYTYDLGNIVNSPDFKELDDKAFNFREFFRVWTGEADLDGSEIPDGSKIGDFVYEKEVRSFLNLITKSDDNSHYPYSTEKYRSMFKHTLWMVPGVKEAKALSNLMQKNDVFGHGFKIVNVAGDGDSDEEHHNALEMVREAIAEYDYTITLSCGRLTTGVTIPEWTGVFMLAGSSSTSATSYLQTIFRVQSPCNTDGKIKQRCYVFDFAPDRTLKMIAESVTISTKAGKTKDSDRRILGKFLNFCPVIAIDGTRMVQYDENKLLQQLKRAYAERVVRNGFDDNHIYNDELLKLKEVDFDDFSELRAIVGASAAQKKTKEFDINDLGFTDEEYECLNPSGPEEKKHEPTPEERKLLEEAKKRKKERRTAISILRQISIRLPLLIYGANVPLENDIAVDNFLDDSIVDRKSWEEFMPQGVTKSLFRKFTKYYDPEVFIVAGRRIRDIVKSSDDLPPTERIQRISDLFSCFKNPDKETVLTPWRVVNMHMSKSLGGYSFFDKDFDQTLTEPVFTNRDGISEATLGNPNAKILEINSKTGLYPLYVAYSIFRAKCNSTGDDTDEFKLWANTVENNIFVVCKTPMAVSITKRTLVGYNNISVNAHYYKDLVNVMRNDKEQFTKSVRKPAYWGKEGRCLMKFDAVVGNPPYQETAEKTSDAPIYHLFMDAAFEISERVTFITPARFLFNAGKTPKTWNEKMLRDEHFTVIDYWEDSSEVFPKPVDIKGGVTITLRDTTRSFKPIGMYSQSEEINSIYQKVCVNHHPESLIKLMILGNKFDLDSVYADHPEVKQYIGSNGRERRLTTSIFTIKDLFKESNDEDDLVEIIGLIDNVRIFRYIKRKYLAKHKNLDHYKVILPKSNGSGEFGEVLSNPMVCPPGVGFTQTFVSIGAFDTLFEAESCLKYLKTKFLRCMLGTLKVTQDNNRETWNNVPIQDFSNKSDIDWTKSIEEIDMLLYSKYGLSPEDIDYIESNVKEMN